ncbi:hypothetical protein AADG42_03365 [Ammonicoccus fulvus]|uniref:Uncharacterized protein n=1 Tax=Ammonicoccus fulvus TaxID=3138240 RepID=A0ABZ3FNI7_9ACTN
MEEITDWFIQKIPEDWFADQARVTVDRDEIVVVGTLAEEDARRFRERTRAERVTIAERAEALFGRKVAWGVRQGDRTTLFTHLATPMMTRLRQPERLVLDTLVSSGVARSRADALSWCVRLVGANEQPWLERLETALVGVDRARRSGPDSSPPEPTQDSTPEEG